MMAGVEAVLEARGLALGYGRRTVVAGVELTIRTGEFWFILGPNGAGKSTLLRAILGVLPPRAGTLRLHPELARRDRIGFVPQRCELNPALPTTVGEFVVLGTVGAAPADGTEPERVARALAQAGLAGRARADYWSLSGGERQRALVARALVRRPRFLVVDEPTSNLDPAAEHALLEVLAEQRTGEHLTVLFVTHDIGLAARYATHVALVAGGRVAAGPAATMLTGAALGSVFGLPMDVSTDGCGALLVHVGGTRAR